MNCFNSNCYYKIFFLYVCECVLSDATLLLFKYAYKTCPNRILVNAITTIIICRNTNNNNNKNKMTD